MKNNSNVWIRAFGSIVLACAFVIAGHGVQLAMAQDTKADDTTLYTLKKRTFKVGEVNRYKLSIKSKAGDMENKAAIVFKETTKEAKPDGQFTVLDEFESAVATVMGAETDISSFLPTITIKRDKSGKLSNKTEGGFEQAAAQITPVMERLPTIQESFLPKDPVKPGDKWKVSINNPIDPNSKAEGEATLIGAETIGGVKSMKLKVISDVDKADAKVHTESVLNVDAESGKLLKIVTKIDGTDKGMKMTQELEMNLSPGDKPAEAGKTN